MECPKCGTENRAEVRFCRHCGERLVLDQPQAPSAGVTIVPIPTPRTVCKTCGAEVKPTARFCPRCGKELLAPSPPSPPQQSNVPTPATPMNTSTGSMDQTAAKKVAPISPPYQQPPQHPSYAQPVETQLTSAEYGDPDIKRPHTEKRQKTAKTKKSAPGWIWGAIIGIILLIAIVIILGTIYIPKALKGTGLLGNNTPTAIPATQTSTEPSPTATPLPTPDPTNTPEPTAEPPVSTMPVATINLHTTPETITVSSQVLVTVSLTNDSEQAVLPLRCDLIGEFSPTLKPSEGITYTLDYPEMEPPLDSGATGIFVYRMDATESGTATLGVSILIGINSPEHRQTLQSQMITLTVQ